MSTDSGHVRGLTRSSDAVQSAGARSWLTIRRKCACGGRPGPDGECAACGQHRAAVRRSPGVGSRAAAVPASVYQALGRSGERLDVATRTFFEPRLRHDFNRVRVHTDAIASDSAAAINAHAYTVGRDIVFGAGRYSPSSPEGRRLMAHELTHVVQQARGGSRVQATSIGAEPEMRIDPEDDEQEREAESVAEASASGGVASPALPSQRYLQRAPKRNSEPTGEGDDELRACMARAKPDPVECLPNRPLAWADFAGAPQSGPFSAETVSDIVDRPMNSVRAKCLQRILGRSKTESRVFQAVLYSKKSWVQSKYKNPTSPELTGCRKQANDCRKHFATLPRGHVGTYDIDGLPSEACRAAVVPAAYVANSRADCATVEANCTRAQVADSARLLAHEQGHFDISCLIAAKANAARVAGRDFATIKTATSNQLRDTQDQYDDETEHGCDAGAQATWATAIANKLPAVTVP